MRLQPRGPPIYTPRGPHLAAPIRTFYRFNSAHIVAGRIQKYCRWREDRALSGVQGKALGGGLGLPES